MGSHWDIILKFDTFRKLTSEELHERALMLCANSGAYLDFREASQDNWLMPLTDLFDKTRKRALTEYRS